MLVVGSFLMIEQARLRSELEQARARYAALEAERQELRRRVEEQEEKLAQQTKGESPPVGREPNPTVHQPVAPAVASLVLMPGMVRGPGEAKRLVIPPQSSSVSLEMNFKQGEYDTYHALLKTVDGDEVARRAGLKAKSSKVGKAVVWRLPANRFKAGDYILILSGVARDGEAEDLASYAFTVLKH